MKRYSPCAAFALLGVAAAMASAPVLADVTNPVGVAVNGTQIQFGGTQPMELHGSVLVPLRGVFESLGASVDYNPATGTIVAVKGDRRIVLPLNSSEATINGQPQQLSQPAQVINDTTLVPLRFVAEALGDYVEWSAPTHMVMIQTQEPPIALAHRDMGADGVLVMGYVHRVITDTTPTQLEVRVNGVDQLIPVADSALIRRGHDHDDVHVAPITDLERGDHVVIRENEHGRAMSITSTFGDRMIDMH